MKTSYRPLPSFLTIKNSEIEGLGLFTKKRLERQLTSLITHVIVGETIYRTPVGGFINHSETPNCELIKTGDIRGLAIMEQINSGQELTIKYGEIPIEGFYHV